MDGRRPGYPQKKKLNMGGGGGIGSSIRSPLVKRDQHSQVVIRGWLYKLEGALAMKQWKKRWFVLADFCLFYYKDSDEEKLLGSILLPSYKINPCISEDRISKKFAFKAEHHNMKTYYFASDSKESMSQWMNAMSLATIMQKDTTTCEVLAERGYGSPVLLDDEESGFSSYRPRRTPQHHHSSINHPSMMNSYHHPERHVRSHSVYPENVSRSREFENGYTTSDSKYRSPNDSLTPRRHPGQPLYANAPPKPRRLTGTYPHEQGASGTDYPLEYSDSQLSDYYPGNNSQYRANQSDRESLDYSSDWPPGMPYQDNYVYGSGYYPATEQQREAVTISRRNEVEAVNASHYHSTQPPRPHSADFLERQSAVDSYTPPVLNNNQVKPRQRPKSSLEQYDRRHYWEDDSPQVSDHGHNYSYEIGVNVVNRERDHWTGNVSSVRRPSDYPLRNLDDNRSPNSSSYGESPSSTLRRSQPNIPHGHQVPIPYDYGLPEIIPDHPKVTVEKEILKDNEPPGLTKWPTMHPTKHPGYPVDPKYFVPDQETPAVVIRRPHHDHHRVRPHSAEYKLGDPAYSQTNHPNYQQQEQMMSDRDQKKVQLREESMRRLLEWKQRMLQSPLSRKYSPRSQPSPRSSPSHSLTARSNVQAQLPLEASPATPTSPPARPPLPEEYRQKVLQDLENHEARLRMRENILPPDNETPYYAGYGPPALMKASDIENQPPYSKEKVILPPEPKKTPQMVAAIHPTKPSHSIAPIHVVAPLSDVNISIESNAEISFPKVEGKMETDKGHAKYHGQFRSQDPRKSSSINRMGQHPSYSSDDEGDSVVGTSSVSDEHMGRQRLRHISGLSKENLNSSDSELHKQTSSKVRRLIQRSQGLSREGKRLSISAGDLLEKSHEELVLLLIQLRRTLSRVAKTREKCHAQLESAQLINRTRLGCDKSLQNWEELKAQIQELEKQYDMTQPLVNLVENMVKLGSLYRGHEKRTLATSTAKLMSYAGQDQIYTPSQNLVEFSNNVVESEKPVKDNGTLNKEIYYLYELNRGYHAESANLMSLHQDKDMLEWTLDSVKGKVNSAGDNTMLVQKLKKQQLLLEKELNRVHNLLSHSTAKIEELTKENGKQEKEILLLKQKVQQALNNSSLDKMPLARANLESELGRVQSVIEELSHQRTEVANSIETLKQESQHCVTSRSSSLLGSPVRASPTGVAGSIPLPVRRKCQTTYFETDLDSLETRDLARVPSHIYFGRESDAPLYVNTDEMNDDKLGNGNESSVESPPEVEYYNKNVLMSLDSAEADRMLDDFYNSQSTDINEADDRMKRFYGILPREKPSEIKTVRIVKRESERRSRVRKKVSYDENHSLVWFEEPDTLLSEGEETDDGVFQDDPYPGVQNRPTTLFFPPQVQSSFPSAREQLFGGQTSICSPSSSSSEFRTPITPLFLLNKPHYPAATQTTTSTASSLDYRAPFKKAKRRHYTISGSQPSMEQNWIKNTGGLRSRDDMDMERCLRTTQINTPDIVRSTIKKVDVFDEKLIERELSLPQKIVIPERYIEVEPPEELSASEKLRRKLKAETIRKMLSETTTYEDIADEKGPTETLRKKLDEEKKKRAHLLALNHTIAKEVMERSKMVAATHTSPEPPPSTN